MCSGRLLLEHAAWIGLLTARRRLTLHIYLSSTVDPQSLHDFSLPMDENLLKCI
jgi:hypothetical protein